MRLSIMFKCTAVLILSILIGSLGIFFTSRHFMHEGFDQTIHNQLQTVRLVVDDTYANKKKALLQEAKMLAAERDLTDAFKANDQKAIADFARKAMRECEANFVMILDDKGTVLARGHSENRGDSFAEFDILGRSDAEFSFLKQQDDARSAKNFEIKKTIITSTQPRLPVAVVI